MNLKNGNILLRPITLDDASLTYLNWLKDPMVNEYTGARFKKYTFDLLRHELWALIKDHKDIHFMAIIYKGEFVGTIKLKIDSRHNKGVISLMIGEKGLWGYGIGTKAIKLLTNWGLKKEGLHHITAGMYCDNFASRKVFLKSGYKYDYKVIQDKLYYGNYVDSFFYVAWRGSWEYEK